MSNSFKSGLGRSRKVSGSGQLRTVRWLNGQTKKINVGDNFQVFEWMLRGTKYFWNDSSWAIFLELSRHLWSLARSRNIFLSLDVNSYLPKLGADTFVSVALVFSSPSVFPPNVESSPSVAYKQPWWHKNLSNRCSIWSNTVSSSASLTHELDSFALSKKKRRRQTRPVAATSKRRRLNPEIKSTEDFKKSLGPHFSRVQQFLSVSQTQLRLVFFFAASANEQRWPRSKMPREPSFASMENQVLIWILNSILAYTWFFVSFCWKATFGSSF